MTSSIGDQAFITDFLSYIQAQCITGMANLCSEAYLLVCLLGMILLALRVITDGGVFGGGDWRNYIMTVIKISVFMYMVNNWRKLTIEILFASFETAGLVAGGLADKTIDASGILNLGFQMTKNVLVSILSTSTWQLVMGLLPLLLLKMVVVVAIILAFGFMALQYTLISIEFYVFASISVILIPFGMIPKLKFLFDNVISGIFSFGVKYMTILFILGLGQAMFSEAALAADSGPEVLLRALVGVLIYAALIIMIPSIVSAMIHGSPSADSGPASMAAGAASTVVMAGGRRIVGSIIGRSGSGTASTSVGRAARGFNMTRSGIGSVSSAKVDAESQKSLANISKIGR